jgi:hypothetical protein
MDLSDGGIVLGNQRQYAAVAVGRMGVPEFETPPLGKPIDAPALLVSRQRQDVRPANWLLAPADRFGHGLPDCDHNRRKHEILCAADQVFAGRGSRLCIPQFDKDVRRGADQVVMFAATDQVVDTFARAFGNRPDGDALRAACLCPALIEGGGNVFNPPLFFRTVGEEQTKLIARRRFRRNLRGGRFPAAKESPS